MIGNGIPGLRPRQYPACSITIGTKGPTGQPGWEKDRFFLKGEAEQKQYRKRDGGTYDALSKPEHPAFVVWHEQPPELRRSIPFTLMHLHQDDAFRWQLRANPDTPGIPRHPRRGPACMGNGTVAQRWDGRQYATIRCPGEQCQYAQGEKPACGPWMSLLGRLAIPKLPTLSFEFKSRGWHTPSNVLGLFAGFTEACMGIGVDPSRVPLFGLPLTMNLAMMTKPGRSFPVVKLEYRAIRTAEGQDVTDLVSWIELALIRAENTRKLAASQPVVIPEPEEADDEARVATAGMGVGRVD